jgi:hypothetical protein
MFEFHSRLALMQTRLELIEQLLHRMLGLIEQLQQQQTTANATTTAHPADWVTAPVRVHPNYSKHQLIRELMYQTRN